MKMKVFEVLDRLNQGYFLPSIQREFVWQRHENKIEKLFDSILQKYPIGYITIWSKNKELDETLNFEVYEFVDHFDEDIPHNREANTNGFREVNLVLDGQQRLTALFIGLKGSYTYSRYNKKKKNKLYINLFSDIEESEDNVEGLKYDIKFFEEIPESDNQLWLEIGKVLDYKKLSSEDFKSAYNKSIEEKSKGDVELQKKALKILGELHNAFCDRDVIQEDMVTDTDDDEKILNIFVRTNDGGMILEKADLLLSYMESNKEFFKPKGARKEIHEFVDELNKEKQYIPNYRFKKDDILKSALVLTDLPVQYKIKNFNKKNLSKISDNWDVIKKYLTITRDLIAKYGFKRRNIISKNALIPISYFLMKNTISKSILDSERKSDSDLRENIIRWLIISTLKQTFGRSGDSRLIEMRDGINQGKSFSELIRGIDLNEEDIEKLIEKEEYGSNYSHLILMLVTDKKYWKYPHQDHIYPQSLFTKEIFKKLGLTEKEIDDYEWFSDSIMNIQLLPESLNLEKTDNDLIDWKSDKNKEFLESQLIPLEMDLDFKNFLSFIESRRKKIHNKLCQILKIKN